MLAVIGLGLVAATYAANAKEPAVKKSRAGICHERGTHGYGQTIHFKSFRNLDACLKSGGRLAKNSPAKRPRFDPARPARPGDDGVIYGPLVKVIDGDTIVVKIQGAGLPIRLIGIDAPELRPEPGQPYADIARSELASMIGEQECVLVYDEGDAYGRLVAHLWIGDNYVNAEMVKRGLAWFDSESAPDNLLDLYQEEARKAKRGLWALPREERIEPREWRNEGR